MHDMLHSVEFCSKLGVVDLALACHVASRIQSLVVLALPANEFAHALLLVVDGLVVIILIGMLVGCCFLRQCLEPIALDFLYVLTVETLLWHQ